ncbi:MAG: hypothetical protein JNM75_08540 [Rhodospirillales bacterium]|nr:hypothetical protein [Rhodospirillales bacterium]
MSDIDASASTAIRFVVIAAPRTGSNWLCTLLDSHPAILCHHEIFNPEGIHTAISVRHQDLGFGTVAERDRNPLEVLDRVWRGSLGHAAVGFKLNRGQHSAVFRHVIADATVRKLVIRRSNRIRTYVSERLAEITGAWESFEHSKTAPTPPAVRIDPAQLRRHVALNRRYYDGVEHALAAASQQRAFEVLYEDLNRPRTRRDMLRFLGVSPDVALRSGTRKQNDAPLDVLIENHDELRRALRGSDLERDLLVDGEIVKG